MTDASSRRIRSASRRGRVLAAAIAVSLLAALGAAGFYAVQAQTRSKEDPAPRAAQPAAGQPGPEKVDGDRPAWTVACFSAGRATPADCKIEQRLYARETGRTLSIAVVDIPGRTRQATLLMQLPNGLALQDGVTAAVDGGAATPLQWQSCDANGCYASLALTPPLLEAMKKGRVMAVRAVAANRQPLVFQHLLTDFTAAYEAAK